MNLKSEICFPRYVCCLCPVKISYVFVKYYERYGLNRQDLFQLVINRLRDMKLELADLFYSLLFILVRSWITPVFMAVPVLKFSLYSMSQHQKNLTLTIYVPESQTSIYS